ncbi:unnamed protein product, partial [Medioppia subpectinata]
NKCKCPQYPSVASHLQHTRHPAITTASIHTVSPNTINNSTDGDTLLRLLLKYSSASLPNQSSQASHDICVELNGQQTSPPLLTQALSAVINNYGAGSGFGNANSAPNGAPNGHHRSHFATPNSPGPTIELYNSSQDSVPSYVQTTSPQPNSAFPPIAVSRIYRSHSSNGDTLLRLLLKYSSASLPNQSSQASHDICVELNGQQTSPPLLTQALSVIYLIFFWSYLFSLIHPFPLTTNTSICITMALNGGKQTAVINNYGAGSGFGNANSAPNGASNGHHRSHFATPNSPGPTIELYNSSQDSVPSYVQTTSPQPNSAFPPIAVSRESKQS